MAGDINFSSGKRKHGLINGDFIIILAILFAVLFSGVLFSRTSKFPNQGIYETELFGTAGTDKDGLQLSTFGVLQCTNKVAINFLIDNSGSMQFGEPTAKIDQLKVALRTFAEYFPPTGAIAMQTYSEAVKERVPFSIFNTSKSLFLEEVGAMGPQTATHSRDAFLVAEQNINLGKGLFPDYEFSLVFISDGIPESRQANNFCDGDHDGDHGDQTGEYCMPHPLAPNACRCFDTNQDPSDIATRIKSNGTRIFTIAFTDDHADADLDDKLQNLMRSIASSPNDYFHAPLNNQLTNIISLIANRVCNQPT